MGGLDREITFYWERWRGGCLRGLVIVGERASGEGQLIVSIQREPRRLCGQTSMERCTLGNEKTFSQLSSDLVFSS